MKILKIFPNLDVHGFDISDLFIESAISKGIDKEKLRISDAVSTNYNNNEFDYSYSIGSLEHFTEEGIERFLHESSRYTKKSSFHMIPVSKIGKDLGWITYVQSYFNNSAGWWYDKFIKYYSVVYIIPSKWDDDISFGRWFICVK
jgi:ubiquinone/menaquinone biosynthesis C-methylase UbiE